MDIGLVPCAAGNTSLSEWRVGSALYNRMIARAKAARAQHPANKIAGLVWHQGESDALKVESAMMYSQQFVDMVAHVR